ncbi:MAG: MBL fold metallo-hydrolase [Blastocatellia bacterium]|nr:MAG: MBL fold metallo-hydrolase [Blastocatellia bacterium]
MMTPLTSGISYFDLDFQGMSRVIATVVLVGKSGVAIIDPGPSSALGGLEATLQRAGLLMSDVNAVLLTHIHLDHAGAAGTLVRKNPKLKVYVHEKGAPHMSNPEKLLASASRLYGDAMDRLWGEVKSVPEDALVVLKGGERLEQGGRQLDVLYTPGHASHHVSYFADDAGIAFVGDTAGVKVLPNGAVLLPTPPPDIDLGLWEQSLAQIEAWRAETLFLTHFGPSSQPALHLSELRDNLQLAQRLVKDSLRREGTDADRENWFAEQVRRDLRQRMSESDAKVYEVAGRFDLNWRGLARYLRKRAA